MTSHVVWDVIEKKGVLFWLGVNANRRPNTCKSNDREEKKNTYGSGIEREVASG